MGQKIHPLGFRLVSVEKHRSIAFIDLKNYPQLICEDSSIRMILQKENKKCGLSKIEIKRDIICNKILVIIYTSQPDIFVGNAGTNLRIIYDNLKKIVKNEKKIILNIIAIKIPDSKASLIGDLISKLLESRIPFKKVIKNIILRTKLIKVLGIKIQISGRLNGADMARTEWVREGRIPLQTLRASIDYAEKRVSTNYGVTGVKVWIFNGELI